MSEAVQVGDILSKDGLVVHTWPQGTSIKYPSAEEQFVYNFEDLKAAIWPYIKGDNPQFRFDIEIATGRHAGLHVASGSAEQTTYYAIDLPRRFDVKRLNVPTGLFLEAAESTDHLAAVSNDRR